MRPSIIIGFTLFVTALMTYSAVELTNNTQRLLHEREMKMHCLHERLEGKLDICKE